MGIYDKVNLTQKVPLPNPVVCLEKKNKEKENKKFIFWLACQSGKEILM